MGQDGSARLRHARGSRRFLSFARVVLATLLTSLPGRFAFALHCVIHPMKAAVASALAFTALLSLGSPRRAQEALAARSSTQHSMSPTPPSLPSAQSPSPFA